jgi:hypothetical protein
MDEKYVRRFFKYVQKTQRCWYWTGAQFPFGYGQMGFGKGPDGRYRNILAHRFSWLYHYGEIPEGMSVLHSCDHPACVRPNHLFLGTQNDNLADMREKNRQARGIMKKKAKLNEADILVIRDLVRLGVAQKLVAALYGISRANACVIVQRKRWGHLQ